ncbi:3-deoxy-D-manno-octulosonic acid transferase [Mucilaginibacter aquatilis]|uniref:3-deoxy-D-manno-octulosonic acid transferase n=1 Tax=Mucilaginibacter aquatilis TaxID=1517760 RepID=A0A6I4IGZ7_9SPHI|nr:glycosyltransferase N-terminal domain-containing protein [Mucilaginibacter aquatilis]MVN92639.1 3-deoxy-D-manno-octulosonic acid transferase [Mucilaginibacter aquatilis]
MLIIYNVSIKIYYLLAIIASNFSVKAKAWINGRRTQKVTPLTKGIWFHFASLGEFEQGRPVLEQVKIKYADHKIVITFFSPSGYEVRKNTIFADTVYYLPLDSAKNAREFIEAINPSIAVFTKYEYWYHYFNELHKRHIPLYVISAIFRPKQIFFKWYGGVHRQMLLKVTRFFVQDEASKDLLKTIGIHNVLISGDTRFDRVYANAQSPKNLPLIETFVEGKKVFVAGSTWPQDEDLLAPLIERKGDWKFIFAPHEIGEEKITRLLNVLPKGKVMRFSEFPRLDDISGYQVLVIDNIGMLSSLYQYGHIAYIGGGFGAGIHNTLEAAAFGLPVVFGPNYQRFKEACDLINLKGGFAINNGEQLQQITDKLIADDNYRKIAGNISKAYVDKSKGATELIITTLLR